MPLGIPLRSKGVFPLNLRSNWAFFIPLAPPALGWMLGVQPLPGASHCYNLGGGVGLEAFLEEESFEGGQVQGQGQWQKELRSTGTAPSHTRICRRSSSLRGLMPWFHRPACGSRPQGPKGMGLALLTPSAHPYLSPSVGWEGAGHKPGTAMHSDPHQIRECELCSEPSSCCLPEGGQRLLLWGQGVPRGKASSSALAQRQY